MSNTRLKKIIAKQFSTYLKNKEMKLSSVEKKRLFELFESFIAWKHNFGDWTESEIIDFASTRREKIDPDSLQYIKNYIRRSSFDEIQILLIDFLDKLSDKKITAKTQRNYKSDIKQFIKSAKSTTLSQLLSKEKLDEFVESQVAKGLKHSSINRKLSSITRFAQFIEQEMIVKEDLSWLTGYGYKPLNVKTSAQPSPPRRGNLVPPKADQMGEARANQAGEVKQPNLTYLDPAYAGPDVPARNASSIADAGGLSTRENTFDSIPHMNLSTGEELESNNALEAFNKSRIDYETEDFREKITQAKAAQIRNLKKNNLFKTAIMGVAVLFLFTFQGLADITISHFKQRNPDSFVSRVANNATKPWQWFADKEVKPDENYLAQGSQEQGRILGAKEDIAKSKLVFNIPTNFRAAVEALSLSITETLDVTGDSSLAGELLVTGDTTLQSDLQVDGDANVDGNLTVVGTSVLTGDTTLNATTINGILTLAAEVVADGVDVDLGAGELTASNILYSLTAGNGLSVSGDQELTVSLDSDSDASNINSFSTIDANGTDVSASGNDDTLILAATGGLTISGSGSTITFGAATTNSGWTDGGSTVALTTIGDNVGIGTATASTKLHVINTTEQLRLGYDASNYLSTTIDSTGDVVFNPSGGGVSIGTGTAGSIDLDGGDLYVTGDLEVDGTIYGSISGSLSVGITQGSVLFTNSSGDIAGDNDNFFWDDASNRLGIGTSSPGSILDINAASQTSGTILDLAFDSSTTLTGDTTGAMFDMDDGSVTATNQNVTGLEVKLPTVTNTITSGTKTLKGFFVSFGTGAGINQNGVGGTTTYNALEVDLPALTQTAGTLNVNGLYVDTPSSITTGGTASGLYLNSAGINAGTLYGLNITSITGGAGSETALAIGTGWDNVLSIGNTAIINGSGVTQEIGGGTGQANYSTGDILYADATDSLSRLSIGNTTGYALTVGAGGTPTWGVISGSACSNCLISNPSSNQVLTPTGDTTGMEIRQTATGSPTADIFAVTNNAGDTKYLYVDSSGTVNIPDLGSASSDQLIIEPGTDKFALQLLGTNVTSSSLQLIDTYNTSGTIFDLDYPAATNLAGDLIGMDIDLNSNLTVTNQSVTGQKITLPTFTNTHTTGTKSYLGIQIAPPIAGGINQNGAGGSSEYILLDLTMPAITQTAGTLNTYAANITTPSSITTGGTAYGIKINSTGVGTGTLRGINIDSITGGAGSETGIYVGSGWDTSAYFAGDVGINKASPEALLHVGTGSEEALDGFNDAYVSDDLEVDGDIFGVAILGTRYGNENYFAGDVTFDIFDGYDFFLETNDIDRLTISSSGTVVFNEAGADADFRVEGDTDPALFFVDASTDNVGIGTTAPSSTLDVRGDVRLNTATSGSFTADVNIKGDLSVFSEAVSQTTLIGRYPAESLSISVDDSEVLFESIQDENTAGFGNMTFRVDDDGTADGYFAFQAKSGTEYLRIEDGGYVGIGKTNPQALLHVGTGSEDSLDGINDAYVTDDLEVDGDIFGLNIFGIKLTTNGYVGSGIEIDVASGYAFNIDTGNTERLNIASDGTVVFNDVGANADFRIEGDTDEYLFLADAGNDYIGIGTSAPSAKLDVIGDATVSGTLTAGIMASEAEAGTCNAAAEGQMFYNKADKVYEYCNGTVWTPMGAPVVDGSGDPLANQVILSGWDSMNPGTTATNVSDTVTYGITFDSAPVVTAVRAGTKVGPGSAPSSLADCDNSAYYAEKGQTMESIGTTSFDFYVGSSSGNYSTQDYVCYTWTAVGTFAAVGADLAENYLSYDNSLTAAEIVSIDTQNNISVNKSSSPADKTAIGVVSTYPEIVLGNEDGSTGGVATSITGEEVKSGAAQSVSVALAGRVPVKVTLENGPIKKGDPITSSSVPGIGMKATGGGKIIGYALEDFDGNFSKQAPLAMVINGQEINQEKMQLIQNQYLDEQNAGIGRVMVFLSNEVIPETHIAKADMQDLILSPEASESGFALLDSVGDAISKVRTFSQATVANLNAGSISAKSLSTESLDISGQSLENYVINLAQEQQNGINTQLVDLNQVLKQVQADTGELTASLAAIEEELTTNRLAIGTTASSELALAVEKANDTSSVAQLLNSSSSSQADVLTLQVAAETAGLNNAFVTFKNGKGETIGEITGNETGGVSYSTSGADFAEYFPKVDPDEKLEPGDPVCLHELGGVNKCSGETNIVGVVSEHAGFVGNSEYAGNPNYVLVGVLGQLPVNISKDAIINRDTPSRASTDIKPGDALTVGPDGKAIKATGPGYILGKALSSPEGEAVLTYINPSYYIGDLTANGNLTSPPSPDLERDPSSAEALAEQNVEGEVNTDLFTRLEASLKTSLGQEVDENQLATLETEIADLKTQIASIIEKITEETELPDSRMLVGDTVVEFDNYGRVLGTSTTDQPSPLGGEGTLATAREGEAGQPHLSGSANSGDQIFSPEGERSSFIKLIAGTIKIDEDGNMQIAGDLDVAGTVTTNKLQISEPSPSPEMERNSSPALQDVRGEVETASLGSATIPAGKTQVIIKTTALTPDSKIFTSLTSKSGGQSLVVEKNSDNSFVVSIENKHSEDISFDWWIVDAIKKPSAYSSPVRRPAEEKTSGLHLWRDQIDEVLVRETTEGLKLASPSAGINY